MTIDAITGREVSVDVALNDDRAGINVGLQFCFLRHVQTAGRVDLAFETPL